MLLMVILALPWTVYAGDPAAPPNCTCVVVALAGFTPTPYVVVPAESWYQFAVVELDHVPLIGSETDPLLLWSPLQ
jgi:hypothetical protein